MVAVIYMALTIIVQLNILSTRNTSVWFWWSKKTAPPPSLKLAVPVIAFLVGATFIAGETQILIAPLYWQISDFFFELAQRSCWIIHSLHWHAFNTSCERLSQVLLCLSLLQNSMWYQNFPCHLWWHFFCIESPSRALYVKYGHVNLFCICFPNIKDLDSFPSSHLHGTLSCNKTLLQAGSLFHHCKLCLSLYWSLLSSY